MSAAHPSLHGVCLRAAAFRRTGALLPHVFSHEPRLCTHQARDVVVTRTLDSGGQNERNEQLSPGSNPLTGPFYIEGAEPGDALRVTLRKVRLNRNWGYS